MAFERCIVRVCRRPRPDSDVCNLFMNRCLVLGELSVLLGDTNTGLTVLSYCLDFCVHVIGYAHGINV
jgi:hypothetical protein